MADTRLATNTGMYRSTRLVGCEVENPQGEHLGSIDDLVIDLGEGRVVAAILAFGGILGVGKKRVPIPVSALGYDPGVRKCLLNVPKEMLKKAPSFPEDEWPEVLDQVWASEVYTHYGCKPYWP